MSAVMKEDKLKKLAKEFAKDLKTGEDLNDFTRELVKLTVETALNAELDDHLGYDKHDPKGHGSGNSRNGTTPKRLKGQHGEVPIDTPRDRNGTFDPQLIRKGQTRKDGVKDGVRSLICDRKHERDL